MNQVRNGAFGLLKTFLFFLLSFLLPMRTKRMLVMTSLYAQLVQQGVFQEETLEKLNDTLELADSPDALQFPMLISRRLWDEDKLAEAIRQIHGHYDGQACLPYEEAKRVSQSIISLVSPTLRYDTSENMVRDTITMFYCHPTRVS